MIDYLRQIKTPSYYLPADYKISFFDSARWLPFPVFRFLDTEPDLVGAPTFALSSAVASSLHRAFDSWYDSMERSNQWVI